MPDFMEATLASLRANIGVAGQREVLVDQPARLRRPALIVWGVEDRVFPYWQGKEAVTLLQRGSLELIPNCGHLPHVEQPRTFAGIVDRFLGERISGGERRDRSRSRPQTGKVVKRRREEEIAQPTNSRERTHR